MGLFSSKTLNSYEELVVDQLQDLYDAEQRLVKALPKMAEAASNQNLKMAFQHHLRQTQGHVQRLEQAFQQLGQEANSQTCDAMKGLISEGKNAIDAEGDPDVKDAALIAAAQRVEHYEIAGYGSARTLAQRIGREDIARLLQETLEEEKETDKTLTELAEKQMNRHAPGSRSTR